MKILYSLLNYSEVAGSQMYFYTLAKEMVKLGHECTVISNIGGEMTDKSVEAGITVLPYSELGRAAGFDIIHASHTPIINSIIENDILPGVPIVSTNHSEVIKQEFPVFHRRVGAYIAIRETVYKCLIGNGVDPDKLNLIYNPIDREIFNTENTSEGSYILFTGSLDTLRRDAFVHTVDYAREIGKKVVHIGRNDYPELESQYPDCKFYPASLNRTDLVKNCWATAGIINGRTALEGFMCGKDNLNFDIEPTGKVIDSRTELIPAKSKMLELYDSVLVAKQIERIYYSLIQ